MKREASGSGQLPMEVPTCEADGNCWLGWLCRNEICLLLSWSATHPAVCLPTTVCPCLGSGHASLASQHCSCHYLLPAPSGEAEQTEKRWWQWQFWWPCISTITPFLLPVHLNRLGEQQAGGGGRQAGQGCGGRECQDNYNKKGTRSTSSQTNSCPESAEPLQN